MREVDLSSRVQAELEALERSARQTATATGRRFMDRNRLSTVSPYARATSWEPLRGRNPTFAVGRGQRAAFFHAVMELRAFRRAYRTALDAWRSGLRNVVFPVGTWLMASLHAARVASA
jgi:hypothetical protein